MAQIHWIGGTGNWDQSTTSHWSTGAVPTASDDVIFDSSSGTGTCTITANAPCRSIQSAGTTLSTLVHNSSVLLSIGYTSTNSNNIALDLSGFTTYTLGNGANSAITFVSTSTTQQTINFNGFTSGQITFNGAGSSYLYTGIQITGTGAAGMVTITQGTVNTNGYACTWGTFAASGSSTRALTLGNSVITVSGTYGGTPWNVTSSGGMTFSGASSTINFTATSGITMQAGTNFSYGTVTFGGSGNMFITGSGASFVTLTRTAPISGGGTITLSNSIAVGALNTSGFTSSNRLSVLSATGGVQMTITLTNNATCSYATFTDIKVSGATITVTVGGQSGGDIYGVVCNNTAYLLQTAKNQSASSGSTITQAFAYNTKAKSLLLCSVICATGTVSSVSDAQSNSWALATSETNGTSTTYLYYAYNVTGGSTDLVTVNLSTTGLVVAMIIREYGGVATNESPLDLTAVATGTTGNISVATAGNTNSPNELVIGVGSDLTSTDAMTVGSGYTNFITDATETSAQLAMEELIISSAATETATFTNSITSTWSGIIATFKIPSASAANNNFLMFM
jgi:hypothetical protein